MENFKKSIFYIEYIKLKEFICFYNEKRTNFLKKNLFICLGGTDKDSRPRICDLKAGSIAHRSDELQIGDMIMSINGIKTQGLKHEEIIDLIKNAGDTLCLEFEYNLPPWRNNNFVVNLKD